MQLLLTVSTLPSLQGHFSLCKLSKVFFCPDNVVILWRDKLSQTHFTECCKVSAVAYSMRLFMCIYQENKDQQWKRAMDYLSAISELNYMTQIVIMLYEDNNKVRDIAVGQIPSCHDARHSPER